MRAIGVAPGTPIASCKQQGKKRPAPDATTDKGKVLKRGEQVKHEVSVSSRASSSSSSSSKGEPAGGTAGGTTSKDLTERENERGRQRRRGVPLDVVPSPHGDSTSPEAGSRTRGIFSPTLQQRKGSMDETAAEGDISCGKAQPPSQTAAPAYGGASEGRRLSAEGGGSAAASAAGPGATAYASHSGGSHYRHQHPYHCGTGSPHTSGGKDASHALDELRAEGVIGDLDVSSHGSSVTSDRGGGAGGDGKPAFAVEPAAQREDSDVEKPAMQVDGAEGGGGRDAQPAAAAASLGWGKAEASAGSAEARASSGSPDGSLSPAAAAAASAAASASARERKAGAAPASRGGQAAAAASSGGGTAEAYAGRNKMEEGAAASANTADGASSDGGPAAADGGQYQGEDGFDGVEMEEGDEEYEEDDFNPLCFMNHLPPYNEVKHLGPQKPMLPAKRLLRGSKPVTLVLDLDETLVHCTVEAIEKYDMVFPIRFNDEDFKVYVRKRPHLEEFLAAVAELFEVVIFTASQRIYAETLLNMIDPKRRFIRYRLYRDACLPVDGNYLKDLNVLGRDLSRVALVDNSAYAYGFQVDNGIPIESWFDDTEDEELLRLLPFLRQLADDKLQDVRPVIRDTFRTHELLSSACNHA